MKKHLMVKNYSSTYGFKLLKVNKKYSMVRVVNDVVQGFQIDEYRRCGRKATYIKYDIRYAIMNQIIIMVYLLNWMLMCRWIYLYLILI